MSKKTQKKDLPDLPEDLKSLQKKGYLDDLPPIEYEALISQYEEVSKMTWIEKMQMHQEHIPELTDTLIKEMGQKIKDSWLETALDSLFGVIAMRRSIENEIKGGK